MNHKINFLTAVVLAAGALLTSATGCELVASVDRSKISGSGGGTGGTGTGGTGTTSSTTSSSTGGTGTGGNTGGTAGTGGTMPMCGAGVMECSAPADCPDPGNECVQRTCDQGCCGTTNVADNTPTTTGQTAKDCKQVVCDGAGATKIAAADADTPDAADACHAGACTAGVPGQAPTAAGTPCAFDNGKVCDGNGDCVACVTDAQCTAPATCVNNACISPTCTDTVKNGTETDLNCGGGNCPPCANGLVCLVDTDCQSNVCTGGICQAPTCGDGKKNGNETGVDCGGTTCNGQGKQCAFGEGCNGPADCVTGACNGVTCTYKPVAAPCASNAECGAAGSNLCVDGVCCNTSCTGSCQACSATKKGGGGDGTCGPVAAGNDPDNDCTDQGAASCGNNGSCDGAGACQKYPLNTMCGAAVCAGNTLTPQVCNATNMCVGGTGTTCANGFKCNAGGTACLTACAADGDCASTTNYCLNPGAGGTCVAKKADGQVCAGDNQCTNGHCVDGVCCNTTCTGTCQACNVAGSLGTCTNVASGGTDSTCASPKVCDQGACVDCVTNAQCTTAGATKCKAATHTCVECLAGTDCASGVCTNDACQTATCSDNVKNGTETDADCGGGTCGDCADTKLCLVNGDCQSDICSLTDGRCTSTVNGCTLAGATDLTGMAGTTITFPNGNFTYTPKCIKVTQGTVITFNGAFSSHPLMGGEATATQEFPASSGPFVPATNAGSTADFTMTQLGAFPYYCVAHAGLGMSGAVFVVP